MARLPYVIPYQEDFLGDGFQVPLLNPSCSGKLLQSGKVYDYIHFSLVMHQERKIALYTAHNIDLSQRRSADRTNWDFDQRIDKSFQTGPVAYNNNVWDRGHLVRRADVVWGNLQEAKDASDATFFYTNAAPQHENFNQEEWLFLEDWVFKKAGGIASKLCVFTGPIYTKVDIYDNNIRIPSAFWKVIVLRDPTANGDDLSALGFVMKQNDSWENWNGNKFEWLRLYQVGIQDIAGYTGIDFGEIAKFDEFEWRQARFRDRTKMSPILIDNPDNIEFAGDRRRARGIRALRVGQTGMHLPVVDDENKTTTIVTTSSCGCEEHTISLEESIKSLSKQVNLLTNIVEYLLSKQDDKDDDRTLRDLRNTLFRIVGGSMVGVGEFEECACLGDGDEYFCSGVLVHKNIVLTAAHCLPNIEEVFLKGRQITSTNGITTKVDRVVVHPEYDSDKGAPFHDIAIIFLENEVDVEPIEFATFEEVNNEDNVVLVGFGYEDPVLPLGFGTKRMVDVPLTNLNGVQPSNITQIEKRFGYDNDFEFHAGRKGLGKDSCNGDSGGPAYLKVNGEFKLAGLTSRSSFSSKEPCGDGGIYTRITTYLDWLGEVTEGLIGNLPGGAANRTNPEEGVYISAAQPNPAGPDEGKEWVEISNIGSVTANLSHYSLMDKQNGVLRLAGNLSSNDKLKVFIPKDSNIQLSNSSEEIKLLLNEEVTHQVSYVNAGSGEIIQFNAPDNLGLKVNEEINEDALKADPC